MKMLKFKRFITTAVILLAAYLLQSTVFPHLELAGIKPNLLLIVTAAFGFMRGPKEGMWIGLAAGLFLRLYLLSIKRSVRPILSYRQFLVT